MVVDDTAVTPPYVHGLTADRELPIIRRIAMGSLRNKLLIILPATLLLSQFLPWIIETDPDVRRRLPLLRGCREALGRAPRARRGRTCRGGEGCRTPRRRCVSGAIRTDFILSAEIMVIALKEVIGPSRSSRGP